jgi:hypothetical protein
MVLLSPEAGASHEDRQCGQNMDGPLHAALVVGSAAGGLKVEKRVTV